MKRFILMLLALTLCHLGAQAAPKRPDEEARYTKVAMRTFFEGRETVSGYKEIPGRGEMYYYAQNDPRWGMMRYNYIDKMRGTYTLGGAGCAPAAFSMFIKAALPVDALSTLFALSRGEKGFPFCICSSSPRFCTGVHERFAPETTEDLAAYLPIIIASYLGGNNAGAKKGTRLLKPLLTKLSIPFTYTTSREDALSALKDGAVIFANTGTYGSPFTSTGHYVLLASYDEGYVYVLDPYYRDDYSQYDRKQVLEIVEPGLVRAKEENFRLLHCSGFTIAYPTGIKVTSGE